MLQTWGLYKQNHSKSINISYFGVQSGVFGKSNHQTSAFSRKDVRLSTTQIISAMVEALRS